MLILPTDNENLVLRELSAPKDDIILFDLINNNKQYWQDISLRFPDVESVTESRLAAADEGELRLGLIKDAQAIGWLSLVRYAPDDEFGNWLGGWMDKSNAGQGLAIVASKAVIKYVRDNPMLNKQITTTTAPTNIAALRVLDKLGFELQEDIEIPYYLGELVFKLNVE